MQNPGTSRKTMNKRESSELKSSSAVKKKRSAVSNVKKFWYNCEDSSGSESDQTDEEFVLKQSDHESDTETSESNTETSDLDDFIEPKPTYEKMKYKRSERGLASQSTLENPDDVIENVDPLFIWNQLINDDILEEILKWTNAKMAESRTRYANENRSELQELDMMELLAFLGIFIYTAVLRANNESFDQIFATDGTGREIFRCVISKNRFVNLLRCFRFDNPADRKERRKTDRLTAMSNIFNKFIYNCQELYDISECVTVDEMLIPFRGRSFLVRHMPNKPAKYGIKLMCLCDAKTGYFYNAYVYTDTDADAESLSEEEKKLLIPTQSVLRLTKPLHNTSRNVTCDNWFTSIELLDALKKRGLTCVGTIKKNKKEVPASFLPSKKRSEGSTLYEFNNQNTLISHVSKNGKAIILASSLHHVESIDISTGKPEIMAYYYSTKGGVDEIDKMCSIYSCSRRTGRWPMALFYRILDISIINTFIVHQINLNKQLDLGVFLKTMARCLTLQHLQRRVHNMRLPRDTKLTMQRLLGSDMLELPKPETSGPKSRKACASCPSQLQRKSSYQCYLCQKHVCLQCAKQTCPDCV